MPRLGRCVGSSGTSANRSALEPIKDVVWIIPDDSANPDGRDFSLSVPCRKCSGGDRQASRQLLPIQEEGLY